MATKPQPQSYIESVPLENRWKLDRKLDFEHDDVQIHLGRIASSMDQWEGRVADELQLKSGEIAAIKKNYSDDLEMQTRAALRKWQEKFGLEATYRNLIVAFLKAGKTNYAEAVCVQLQTAQVKVSSPKFQCPCNKCTLDSYIANGCPSFTLQGKRFPYLNVSGLSNDERIDLEGKLWSDFEDIVTKFGSLVCSVEKSLCQKNVSPRHLENCIHFISDLIPVLKDLKPELEEAESISKIFSILSDYLSFFNFEILKHIIKNFGTESDQEKLEQYTKDFQEFCKRSVFEVPPEMFGHVKTVGKKCCTLAIKMTSANIALVARKTPKLNDLIAVKQKIAKLLGITASSLYLCRVDEGCVEMLFLVPRCVFKAMLQKSFTKQAMDELSMCGLAIVKERTQTYEAMQQSATTHLSCEGEGKSKQPKPEENPQRRMSKQEPYKVDITKRPQTVTTNPSGDPLTTRFSKVHIGDKPDFGDLYEVLLHHNVHYKLVELGWLLEMDKEYLIFIPEVGLRILLHEWLRRDNPPPTWSAIIKAVSILGYKDLAEHLQQQYVSQAGQRSPHTRRGVTMIKSSEKVSVKEDYHSAMLQDSSGKPDFRVLCEQLRHYQIQDKWLKLGGVLGIRDQTMRKWKKELNDLERTTKKILFWRLYNIHEDPDRYIGPQSGLRRLLLFWLNRDDPPPTWSAMIEALDKLGDENLAEELRGRHQMHLQLYSHYII